MNPPKRCFTIIKVNTTDIQFVFIQIIFASAPSDSSRCRWILAVRPGNIFSLTFSFSSISLVVYVHKTYYYKRFFYQKTASYTLLYCFWSQIVSNWYLRKRRERSFYSRYLTRPEKRQKHEIVKFEYYYIFFYVHFWVTIAKNMTITISLRYKINFCLLIIFGTFHLQQ